MTSENDPLLRCLRTQYGDETVAYPKPLVQVLVGSPVGCSVFRSEAFVQAPRTRFVRAGDAVGVWMADLVIEQPELVIELFSLHQMAYDSAFKEAE